MANTMQQQRRQASPARWRKAVERAIGEHIHVRQLAGSGGWIATSGSDANTAYEIEVTGEVAHGCNCLAGLNGDPVCKHRAAFYLAVGLLDPEPEPAAPAPCGYSSGRGWGTVVGKSGAEFRFACPVCDGAGTEPVGDDEDEPAFPAAPVPVTPAPAAPAVCARCGGAGRLSMTVAGGCAVYAVATACHACHGAGTAGSTVPMAA